MNADMPEEHTPSSDTEPAAAPAARKRAPRSRKPAASPEAAPASVEATPEAPAAQAEAAPAPDAVAEPAAPKARKPRARKPAAEATAQPEAAVADVAPAPATEALAIAAPEAQPLAAPVAAEPSLVAAPEAAPADATAVADAPAKPRRRTRTKPAEEAGVAAQAQAPAAPAAPAAVEAVEPAPDAVPAAAAVDAPANAGEVFTAVLLGEFDVEDAQADAAPAQPEKRVLLPDADAPKLHKVLAQSGVGSRREMEQAIEDGRISVNGEKAHTGMRVSFGDKVTLDGKPVRIRIAPPPPRIIAYHKPAGEVVTFNDPEGRPTVFRKLPRLMQGKWQSVGRLDMNTEGLLLFTTSGDLANKLMHPRFGVEREYAVRVLGTLEKEQRERLLQGVEIEGQQAAFLSVEDGGGEGVNRWYRVVITEGRNREVRKLFDAVGLTVSRLIRIRYGCVVLPRGLKRGVWVDLSEADVKALRQLTATQGEREGQGQGAGQARSGKGDRRGGKPERGAPQGEGKGARGKGDRPERAERGERVERTERYRDEQRPAEGAGAKPQRKDKPRRERGENLPREQGDPSRIPNPLLQTFDRRAAQQQRSRRNEEDLENGPIPNPLEQTFDKRFVQAGRGPLGTKAKGGKGGAGGQRQPDPMQTSLGYLGQDAFERKFQGRGGGGRRGGR